MSQINDLLCELSLWSKKHRNKTEVIANYREQKAA